MKQFNYVQAPKPKRSAFDLSHGRRTTLNPAELTPVLCKEVLPGDRFILDMEAFLRTMPLISPVMHHVNLYAHAFFVPNRLIYGNKNRFINDAIDSWEDFITGKQEDDLPSWDPTYCWDSAPVNTELLGKNSLIDHLNYGLYDDHVSNTWLGKPLSQGPIRAYHKIWSDYYRDQNYQNEPDWDLLPNHLDSQDFGSVDWFFEMRKRCFEKDYFTSALLTQQRGSAVSMPLGTTAPVSGRPEWELSTAPHTQVDAGSLGTNSDGETVKTGGVVSGGVQITEGSLEADLSNATSATISQLRQAFALQRWYEASMRFGQRYVEQLLGLFGVVSKDARLQRAEFLAGGKLPVQIGEVLQTSQTTSGDDASPQGNMSGRAVSYGGLMHIDRTFDEHGWFMIIVSVIPRTAYVSFCDKQNLKLDRFDFAFPQFAHLSESPIYNQEIFQDNASNQGSVFGYRPIYDEYRYIPDTVHGEFKDTLKFWSLAREFAEQPTLSEQFVLASFPQNVFATISQEQTLILQSYYKFTAIRPLPKHGTPI